MLLKKNVQHHQILRFVQKLGFVMFIAAEDRI